MDDRSLVGRARRGQFRGFSPYWRSFCRSLCRCVGSRYGPLICGPPIRCSFRCWGREDKDWSDLGEGKASVFKPDGNGGYKLIVRIKPDERSKLVRSN